MSVFPQLEVNLTLQKSIELAWSYVSTTNRIMFFIEKSKNNIDFEKIGLLNTAIATSYEFSDLFPTKGISYYRLVSVDENGELVQSPTQQVCLLF